MKYHQHLLIDANVANPPKDEQTLKDWFTRLVKAVDMEMFHEPLAKYCDDPENRGITGMVWLTTSHSSIHFWDNCDTPFVKFDLYSCKEFTAETVLNLFQEFNPISLNYTTINRTSGEHIIEERGSL